MAEISGTPVVLQASGGAIPAGSFAVASTELASSDDPGYELVRFELEVTYGTSAPTQDKQVSLFKAAQNLFGGTDDEAAPSTSVLDGYMVSRGLAPITTAQRWLTEPLPRDTANNMKISVLNGDAIQSITAWKLRAIPTTYGAPP